MSVEKKKTPKNGSPAGETTKKKTTKPKVSSDKKKVNELKQKVSDLEDSKLRLKAEFDNFRKRRDKEMLRLLEYEGEDILKEILPIIDDLERVVGAVGTNKNKDQKDEVNIKEGINLIISKVKKFLKKRQVEEFGKPGEIMDIELHDAMMVKNEESKKENEILDVFENGYKYKDHVLRHAKVIVNKE